MDKDKMMELDKMVFEWWRNTEEVALIDICNHFSVESITNGECAENFKKLIKEKHGKTEET